MTPSDTPEAPDAREAEIRAQVDSMFSVFGDKMHFVFGLLDTERATVAMLREQLNAAVVLVDNLRPERDALAGQVASLRAERDSWEETAKRFNSAFLKTNAECERLRASEARLRRIVDAQAAYIKLLEDECADWAPYLSVHGMRSTRVEAGKAARAAIAAASSAPPADDLARLRQELSEARADAIQQRLRADALSLLTGSRAGLHACTLVSSDFDDDTITLKVPLSIGGKRLHYHPCAPLVDLSEFIDEHPEARRAGLLRDTAREG